MEGVIQSSRGRVDSAQPSRRAKANKRAKPLSQEESENNTEEEVVVVETRLMNDSRGTWTALPPFCRLPVTVCVCVGFFFFFTLKFVSASR